MNKLGVSHRIHCVAVPHSTLCRFSRNTPQYAAWLNKSLFTSDALTVLHNTTHRNASGVN